VSTPSIGRLGDHVAGVIDDIGVVAHAAHHGVRARAAVEEIGAVAPLKVIGGPITDQHVVQPIANAVDRRRSGEEQVLHIGAEAVGDAGVDGVEAAAGRFGDGVAAVIDNIGVVAHPAGQDVGARAAVQPIISRAAGDDVVEAIADAGE
jgi:hypothetical protein